MDESSGVNGLHQLIDQSNNEIYWSLSYLVTVWIVGLLADAADVTQAIPFCALPTKRWIL